MIVEQCPTIPAPSWESLSAMMSCPAEGLSAGTLSRCRDDVLLFAGDASDKLENVEWAFKTLASAFGMVVYVPGNHGALV